MTSRSPWWYSGDEPAAGDEPAPEPGVESLESLEDPGSPDDADPTADTDPTGDTEPGPDWMALLSGAARMVDWATSAVMAPHAEHADPAEHPQCVVCRTILLVGDPVPPPAPESTPAEPITWIPFRD